MAWCLLLTAPGLLHASLEQSLDLCIERLEPIQSHADEIRYFDLSSNCPELLGYQQSINRLPITPKLGHEASLPQLQDLRLFIRRPSPNASTGAPRLETLPAIIDEVRNPDPAEFKPPKGFFEQLLEQLIEWLKETFELEQEGNDNVLTDVSKSIQSLLLWFEEHSSTIINGLIVVFMLITLLVIYSLVSPSGIRGLFSTLRGQYNRTQGPAQTSHDAGLNLTDLRGRIHTLYIESLERLSQRGIIHPHPSTTIQEYRPPIVSFSSRLGSDYQRLGQQEELGLYSAHSLSDDNLQQAREAAEAIHDELERGSRDA